MKRMVGLLAILLISYCCLAYCGEMKTDGVHNEYYPSGKVQYERNYKNGFRDGLSKKFYEDGTLGSEAVYVAGKKQGILKEYYPNGTLSRITTYKDDLLNGMLIQYNRNGIIDHENMWKNGEPTSETRKSYKYYADKSLKYETFYNHVDGSSTAEGFTKKYYENGQLWKECVNKDGEFISYKEYDESGNIVSQEIDGCELLIKAAAL